MAVLSTPGDVREANAILAPACERVYDVDGALASYGRYLYACVELRRRCTEAGAAFEAVDLGGLLTPEPLVEAANAAADLIRANADLEEAVMHLAQWTITGSPAAEAYAAAMQP